MGSQHPISFTSQQIPRPCCTVSPSKIQHTLGAKGDTLPRMPHHCPVEQGWWEVKLTFSQFLPLPSGHSGGWGPKVKPVFPHFSSLPSGVVSKSLYNIFHTSRAYTRNGPKLLSECHYLINLLLQFSFLFTYLFPHITVQCCFSFSLSMTAAIPKTVQRIKNITKPIRNRFLFYSRTNAR